MGKTRINVRMQVRWDLTSGDGSESSVSRLMRPLITVVLILCLTAQGEEERAGLDWWAFQPVVRPVVPSVEGKEKVAAIDAFVRARQKSS